MQPQSDNHGKFKNLIIAIFFFISPLLFLNIFLEKQKNTELAQNAFNWQEHLTREMNDFYELLKPTTYIDNLFTQMHQELGLVKKLNTQSQPLVKMNKDPFLPSDYLAKSEAYLKNEHGVKAFLWTYKNQAQRAELKTNINIFRSPRDERRFAEGLLDNYLQPAKHNHVYQAAQGYIAKHISLFATVPLIPSKSEQYFSGKFGNQLSYHIFNQYPLNSKDTDSLEAVDYFCFNATDLDNQALLTHASKKSQNPKISREILQLPHKSQLKLPSFRTHKGRLYYLKDYPSDYLTYCRNQSVFSEELSRELLAKANASCLAVSVPSALLDSSYQKQLSLNQKLTWATLFLLWFLYVKSLVHTTPLSLRLTNKLRLTVAVSIIVPLVGVTFAYELIRSKAESLIISECQTKIARQFKLFEKICESNDMRLIIEAQKYKKHLADSFFNAPTPRHFYHNFRRTRQYPHSQYIRETRLFDSAVNLTGVDEGAPTPSPIADSLSYYQLFRDLKLIDHTLANSADLAKQDMIIAITDSYWQLVLTQKRLAAESILDYDLNKLNSNRKVAYQLLAPSSAPNAFKALAINSLKSNDLQTEMLFNLLYKNPSFTSDITDKYHINYGIFSYNINKQTKNFKNNLQFSPSLFNLAVNSGANENFNFFLTPRGREKVIEASTFSSRYPFIFAAEAKIFNTNQIHSDNLLFYMFVLSYIIISTILLSRTLANALIRPISTLTRFINSIKKIELETRLEVGTGDELESLAHSLNSMAQELENKEKMRRFVSEKLYSSLGEESQEKALQSQLVTILSSDIRSFTQISESHPPEVIVSLLNDYITEMEKAIIQNGGTIEKIIGDAITASFYEDKSLENTGTRAVKAAIQMRNSLKAFNQARMAKNEFTIENGIGLATGEVVLGFIGETSKRREFILIGEPIQRAEALESSTPTGKNAKIFLDKKTQEMLDPSFKLSENLDKENTKEIIL